MYMKLAKYVSKLPNLKSLDISGNQIKTIPDSVWDLKKLEHLNISGNELSTLDGIDRLENLVTLIADDNNISEVDLCKNEKLTHFSMQRNNFEEYPEFAWSTLISPYLKIQLDGNPCVDKEANINIDEHMEEELDEKDQFSQFEKDLEEYNDYSNDEDDGSEYEYYDYDNEEDEVIEKK
eukprot:CAMPEP_0114332712 /NCGR_PEP_ID=MMETSP0101-20121206/3270_1 /TAXON_ID=38822 ORGANISM="Pteridomonas danica, Strain PT" /NCGR_SAMPLE_ID=MMETSP0101 /ASSEMBLY_ACC=CAM_ASM_000211 /LENGTH=178 /DNA_ID=CAMNT_0001463487 /DNA_START=190 /DNA_END=727 /DNA_ORIENTATION=+